MPVFGSAYEPRTVRAWAKCVPVAARDHLYWGFGAGVAELADALDSKSSEATPRAGSTPALGTIFNSPTSTDFSRRHRRLDVVARPNPTAFGGMMRAWSATSSLEA